MRLHERCRKGRNGGVSIHAPTRDATKCYYFTFQNLLFQSTHPHGMRRCRFHAQKVIFLFQSTHPHGMRHAANKNLFGRIKFQSTHPHGMRQALSFAKDIISVRFQSTHPHGMRQTRLASMLPDNMVSIHAPTRDATP